MKSCLLALFACAAMLLFGPPAQAQCPTCPKAAPVVVISAPKGVLETPRPDTKGVIQDDGALWHSDGKVYLRWPDGKYRECVECTVARQKIEQKGKAPKLVGTKPGCNCYPCECNK